MGDAEIRHEAEHEQCPAAVPAMEAADGPSPAQGPLLDWGWEPTIACRRQWSAPITRFMHWVPLGREPAKRTVGFSDTEGGERSK